MVRKHNDVFINNARSMPILCSPEFDSFLDTSEIIDKITASLIKLFHASS